MQITVLPFTIDRLQDVVDFEKALREEEDVWGWDIDEEYIKSLKASFANPSFSSAISFLAYDQEKVVGRIDASLIHARFDGQVRAYLDWICVLKSYRHQGIAQRLLEELRKELKGRGVESIVALTAANEEAQSFYRSIPDSEMHDVGIWINLK